MPCSAQSSFQNSDLRHNTVLQEVLKSTARLLPAIQESWKTLADHEPRTQSDCHIAQPAKATWTPGRVPNSATSLGSRPIGSSCTSEASPSPQSITQALNHRRPQACNVMISRGMESQAVHDLLRSTGAETESVTRVVA